MKLRRFDYIIKGIESPRDIFFRYFFYTCQWFFKFFGCVVGEIFNTKILLSSMKTLTNSEICRKPQQNFYSASYICHRSIFSCDELSLDSGKIGLLTLIRMTKDEKSLAFSKAYCSKMS
jgi:hypothetical protein